MRSCTITRNFAELPHGTKISRIFTLFPKINTQPNLLQVFGKPKLWERGVVSRSCTITRIFAELLYGTKILRVPYWQKFSRSENYAIFAIFGSFRENKMRERENKMRDWIKFAKIKTAK